VHWPRLWERLGGPRHLRRKRGHGAGRVCLRAAPPPREQAHQAGGAYAHDYPGHDQENVEQLSHGVQDRHGDPHDDRCAALVATIGFPAPVVVPVVGTG
jgi:hypothetical protein